MQPWHPEEHINKFAIHLTREQESFAHHDIVIGYTIKNNIT